MTIALLIVGASLIGAIIAFSFYCVRTIVRTLSSNATYAAALANKTNEADGLTKDIFLWADENKRLKGAIKALESQNAYLLKNSKLTPGDVIKHADDQLRGLLPNP